MALPQEPEGLQPGTQLRVSLCFVEMEQGRFIILPRNLELPTHGITSQYVVMPILSHGLSMSNWYNKPSSSSAATLKRPATARRNEGAIIFSVRQCQKAARVPLSEGVCSPLVLFVSATF